jgi:hypothetical protein
MKQAVKDVTAPEFTGWEGNTRLGPYYTNAEFPGHYEFGMLSPYGEQVRRAVSRSSTWQPGVEDLVVYPRTYGG